MNDKLILSLVKARLGISSKVRDTYLSAIIKGIVQELGDIQGITLNKDNQAHIMFIVDYSTWRYESRDEKAGMPRHLQWRLHNLYIKNGGNRDE